MTALFRSLWRDRRGNALVIAAAAMPLVLGSAGLASDTIEWALWKRQLQRAADSAAMAGVYSIAANQGANSGVQDAVTRDLEINSHVGITTVKDVQSSPTVGAYTSDPYAVRVALSVQKALSFSSLFLSAAPTISVAATATVVPSGEYCVISLINTASTGILSTGNSTVDMGCGMITNSTSMAAAVATGSTIVNASPIAAVGGISANGDWGSGTLLQPFTLAQEDPFASVPPPSFPAGACPSVTINPNTSYPPLDPGCFTSLTLNGTIVLNPGIYVLDAGSLSIGAQAVVTCNGCTFVLSSRTAATNPSSIGTVNMNGGAQVNLTAPGEGTYAGLVMYQDRRALSGTNANRQNFLNGNSNSSFQGAFYFPSQTTTFNGTAGMTTTCMQLVAYTVNFSGNMSIANSCPANSGASAFTGKKVRLVE